MRQSVSVSVSACRSRTCNRPSIQSALTMTLFAFVFVFTFATTLPSQHDVCECAVAIVSVAARDIDINTRSISIARSVADVDAVDLDADASQSQSQLHPRQNLVTIKPHKHIRLHAQLQSYHKPQTTPTPTLQNSPTPTLTPTPTLAPTPRHTRSLSRKNKQSSASASAGVSDIADLNCNRQSQKQLIDILTGHSPATSKAISSHDPRIVLYSMMQQLMQFMNSQQMTGKERHEFDWFKSTVSSFVESIRASETRLRSPLDANANAASMTRSASHSSALAFDMKATSHLESALRRHLHQFTPQQRQMLQKFIQSVKDVVFQTQFQRFKHYKSTKQKKANAAEQKQFHQIIAMLEQKQKMIAHMHAAHAHVHHRSISAQTNSVEDNDDDAELTQVEVEAAAEDASASNSQLAELNSVDSTDASDDDSSPKAANDASDHASSSIDHLHPRHPHSHPNVYDRDSANPHDVELARCTPTSAASTSQSQSPELEIVIHGTDKGHESGSDSGKSTSSGSASGRRPRYLSRGPLTNLPRRRSTNHIRSHSHSPTPAAGADAGASGSANVADVIVGSNTFGDLNLHELAQGRLRSSSVFNAQMAAAATSALDVISTFSTDHPDFRIMMQPDGSWILAQTTESIRTAEAAQAQASAQAADNGRPRTSQNRHNHPNTVAAPGAGAGAGAVVAGVVASRTTASSSRSRSRSHASDSAQTVIDHLTSLANLDAQLEATRAEMASADLAIDAVVASSGRRPHASRSRPGPICNWRGTSNCNGNGNDICFNCFRRVVIGFAALMSVSAIIAIIVILIMRAVGRDF